MAGSKLYNIIPLTPVPHPQSLIFFKLPKPEKFVYIGVRLKLQYIVLCFLVSSPQKLKT